MTKGAQRFRAAARVVTAISLFAMLSGCIVYAPPYRPYHPYHYYYYGY